MTMKRCPQCDTELNQDGDLTNCHQCGFDLIVPKTIVVDDMVNDSKISDSRPTTTVSEVIVVEEFSIEQDLLNIDSTQESDDLETDLLKDKTAISKQLSIDAATQQSELSDRPVPAQQYRLAYKALARSMLKFLTGKSALKQNRQLAGRPVKPTMS